jgi:hypothetical protein
MLYSPLMSSLLRYFYDSLQDNHNEHTYRDIELKFSSFEYEDIKLALSTLMSQGLLYNDKGVYYV